jgi:hypothetical protein
MMCGASNQPFEGVFMGFRMDLRISNAVDKGFSENKIA